MTTFRGLSKKRKKNIIKFILFWLRENRNRYALLDEEQQDQERERQEIISYYATLIRQARNDLLLIDQEEEQEYEAAIAASLC